MSYPSNDLAKFRTYQFHHVLVACQGTRSAEALSDNGVLERLLSKRQARPVGKQKYIPSVISDEKVVVILDGRFDADFIIDSINWDTILTPDSGNAGTSGFTSMAVEGAFMVTEPRGIDFMNQLANVSDALDSEFSSIIYVIKTYFVGLASKSNLDTSAPEYITHVKPLLFSIYNVTAAFDNSGSTYNVDFIGINNGAAKLPQVVKGSDLVNVAVKSETTIVTAMVSLETELNALAKQQLDTFRDNAEEAGLGSDVGILVKYRVVLDDHYIENESNYKIDETLSQTQSEGKNDTVLHFGKTSTIESAIDKIMQSSSEVSKDAKGKGVGMGGGPQKFIYKIVSTIITAVKERTIVYVVRRYEIPVSTYQKAMQADAKKFKTEFADKGQGIIFDYFYTGKNIDIMEFDMKMENGLFFLQTLSSANSMSGDASSNRSGIAAQSIDKPKSNTTITPNGSLKKNTPIYINTKLDDVFQRNTKNTKSRVGFKELLSAFAGMESIEAKIKILGNVNLLSNVNAMPSDITDKKEHKSGGTNDVMSKWDSVPGLVKINILMPQTGDQTVNGPYEPFWFDGLYYVYSIQHSFSNGEFFQTIDMMSLLTDSPLAVSTEASDDSTKKVETKEDKASGITNTSNKTNKVKPPKSTIDGDAQTAENETAITILNKYVPSR